MLEIWARRKTEKFQTMLLEWYTRQKRELPWRSDPSPYRVWVSEIMLQQTQVRTVLPYYNRFLDRFPNVHTLADAKEQEVVAAWAGLGYYGRARNLHRAAIMIVREHGGNFPDTLEAISKLPGVGRYTAGAVYSIAFNRPAPIVDGNIRRVITRLHNTTGQTPESFFWGQARAWIPEGRASDFNQAVMELGALVCVASTPLCLICPVRSLCEARKKGIQDQIPPPRSSRAAESVHLNMLVLEQNGHVLLVRQRDATYIPGEWGLPTSTLRDDDVPERVATRMARKIAHPPVQIQRCVTVRHSITYRKIIIHVFHGTLGSLQSVIVNRSDHFCWMRCEELDQKLTSSAFRKAVHSAIATQACRICI